MTTRRSAWINALMRFIPALIWLAFTYSVWRDPRPPELVYTFGGLTLGLGCLV